MRQPMSRPARSVAASGPMGKPKSTIAASISSGSAPSRRMRSVATFRCRSMRLPTKPCALPTTTGTLPSRRARVTSAASVSGVVSRPRTISTRRITFAGLKKCMPATEPGRSVASRDAVDVEVGRVGGEECAGAAPARRAWRRLRASHAMSSKTASTTRSASRTLSIGAPSMRAIRRSASSAASLPRFAASR